MRLRLAATVLCLASMQSFSPVDTLAAAGAGPRFNGRGELMRPQGYREWVFVGSSLAMSYEKKPEKVKHLKFHHLYINRDAYYEFEKSGTFPEGTILVMEVLTAGSHASINRQGHFADQVSGLEAAVKDSSRFPERWAYFSFDLKDGSLSGTAKAFAKERCWSCHNEHAQTDNVFTQFYPVLTDVR